MTRLILILIFTISSVVGMDNLKPSFSINAHGDVQDMVYLNNTLYVATSVGVVDVFNIKNRKIQGSIKIPKIKDISSQPIDAKIYSIDTFANQLIFVSEGENGHRNLWFSKDNRCNKLISTNQKWTIKEAKFVDKNRVLIALLSNELILWEINTRKIIYRVQPTSLYFSHFALSEDRKTFVTTDESGEIRQINSQNGKVIRVYSGINLDKIFQLDYKKGVILSGGQDRKAGIYGTKSNGAMDFDFLLYSVALSSDAKYGAIAYNENSDIVIIDILGKNRLYNLQGSVATITKIIFMSNKQIIASSEDKKINIWSIK